jgi:hypothetical protein
VATEKTNPQAEDEMQNLQRQNENDKEVLWRLL